MKLSRIIAAAGLLFALAATPAQAIDEYDDSQSNPLRIAAYLLHPIGYAAEWLIARPFHQVVAQDDLSAIFGHTAHEGFDYESYTEGLSTGVTYELPYPPIRQPAPR